MSGRRALAIGVIVGWEEVVLAVGSWLESEAVVGDEVVLVITQGHELA